MIDDRIERSDCEGRSWKAPLEGVSEQALTVALTGLGRYADQSSLSANSLTIPRPDQASPRAPDKARAVRCPLS